MPTKIRLQRRGKKGQAFYHIVIADGRAPRDGKFIERIGSYNPLTKPAEITINFEKALDWVQKGAQPTDTVKTLLTFKGVMFKHHLLKGVQKGAMTPEQAEVKFQAWLEEKQQKISSKKKEQELNVKDSRKKAFEDEQKVNEAKAASVARKLAKEHLDEASRIAQAAHAAHAAVTTEVVPEPVAEVAPEIIAEVAPQAEEPKQE